jgi:hypothetical protein
MSTVPLPDDPSFEQLRKIAKDIRDLAQAGDPGVLQLVATHHPDGAHPVSLAGAQLVLARHHGFASWARLKQHIETIQRYRRVPDELDVEDLDQADVVDRFLALACLRYGGDDSPERWAQALQLVREHPGITRSSIHAAAAGADVDAVRALLRDDSALARREGGPYQWEPLMYLAYARHDPAVTEPATLATARALVDQGADPNVGYLWHGLPTPFTALTGALGSGEGDQPPHPHGYALAALLLDAGADPNDGQALYNRQFRPDDRHLELLLAHGLGHGDGGPWRARLGQAVDAPEQLVRIQLWWAIVHDMRDRVRLLAEHGADILTPFAAPGGRPTWARTSDGRTPAELAALAGCPEMVDWLVDHGATRPAGEGVDGFVAAALRGDRDEVQRLMAYRDEARAQRPALIVWATARRKLDAVRLLAEVGFDVNAKGRTDVPMEQQWETALHQAAGEGDVELTRLLLDLGADPTIEDTRFGSTSLGWARHFDQPATIELLEALTP